MKDSENCSEDAVALIDSLLAKAQAIGASDMYWIPEGETCRVLLRVNGVQQSFHEVQGSDFIARCAARLKVLSGMLTYRSKRPQDGAIRAKANTACEFRVAAMPTVHGERITVRLLDRRAGGEYLDGLGFQADALAELRAMLEPDSGLIVLTGPTGSGKTTTIYAMIRELLGRNQDPASIITIEDPVERLIPGVSQVSLTRSTEDWGYEEALKAALRQDVKTVVIGEIRDQKIAKAVLNAALSGHRVITTFHAGDIPSVYARLLHQGFEPFLIAASITGVVSQRLVLSGDGREMIPVAGVLRPDNDWRDLVTANPGLTELRSRIAFYPGGDLRAVARKMNEEGKIASKDAYLI